MCENEKEFINAFSVTTEKFSWLIRTTGKELQVIRNSKVIAYAEYENCMTVNVAREAIKMMLTEIENHIQPYLDKIIRG